MQTVTIHDAKTNLSKYIKVAQKGQPVIVGSHGKPQVAIINIKDLPYKKKKRDFSIFKDKIWAAPDAFSEETDKEIADLMYGRDDDPLNL